MKTYGKDRVLGGEKEVLVIATGGRRFVARRKNPNSDWFVDGLALARGYKNLRHLKAKLDATPGH